MSEVHRGLQTEGNLLRMRGARPVIAHIALVFFVVVLGLGRLGDYLAEGVVGIDGDEVRGVRGVLGRRERVIRCGARKEKGEKGGYTQYGL